MQDRDWTGIAAAVTALAMTAGVWLWPPADTPRPEAATAQAVALDPPAADEMARWQAEARRWDGPGEAVQISSAQDHDTRHPVIR